MKLRSAWVNVSSIEEICAHLRGRQQARLHLANGRVLRIFRMGDDAIFVCKQRSSRRGWIYHQWPSSWGTTARLQLLAPRWLQTIAGAARCIARHAPPDVWPDLREEALAVVRHLEDLGKMDGSDAWDTLESLGVRHLLETNGVTTLRAQGCPAELMREVQERFARRDEIDVRWQGKYDCSVHARPGNEHGYYPSLATEYRGLLHGHYWALVDGYHAVHLETD